MLNHSDALVNKLAKIGHSYAQIAQGIDSLTAVHQLHLRERILLAIVRRICTQRLRELVLLLPEEDFRRIFCENGAAEGEVCG